MAKVSLEELKLASLAQSVFGYCQLCPQEAHNLFWRCFTA